MCCSLFLREGDFISKSSVGGRTYDDFDMAFIGNPVQTYLYMKHGAYLFDVLWGRDQKLTFVFSKKETQPLYELWKRHELE